MTRGLGVLLFAGLLAGNSAQAAESGPMAAAHGDACVAIPPDLLGWSAPHVKAKAAVKAGAAGKVLLASGVAADVALSPTPRVAYAIEPGKPGGSVSYGGLLAFYTAQAGRYRVAQSGRSWVDVIVDGKAATSAAHGHGPACSGIAKMVDYDLPAGRHLLQIAANGEPVLTVMVTPVR